MVATVESPELERPMGAAHESSPKAVHEPLVPRTVSPMALKTPMQVDCFVPSEPAEKPFDGTTLRPFDKSAPLANFSPGAPPHYPDSLCRHARQPASAPRDRPPN